MVDSFVGCPISHLIITTNIIMWVWYKPIKILIVSIFVEPVKWQEELDTMAEEEHY